MDDVLYRRYGWTIVLTELEITIATEGTESKQVSITNEDTIYTIRLFLGDPLMILSKLHVN